MPRRFGRLPFFSRPGAADRASRGQSAVEVAPIDPDAAPVGPLTLLPAMIHRQVLFDVTEITPAWLRSRPRPEREPARPGTSAAAERVPKPAASTDKAPTTKATRRKQAGAKPAEPKPAATRRPRGPSAGRHKSR
jgi:hypothetical protein